jgi:hypothetical protein
VGNCSAVGGYSDSSNNELGLLLTETSGTWATGVEASLPANAGTNPNAFISSVSCPSAGNCGAVGQYNDSSNNKHALLMTESSGVWATGVDGVLPANAQATNALGNLFSVSCPAPGNCTAVANYLDGSGNIQGLFLNAAPATPTLSAQAPASAPAGSAISASSISAALAGGSAPTGTVTFKVFGPQSEPPAACTSAGTTLGSASVSGNATYHPSSGFTPSVPGRYWWYATYGGDTSDNAAASACGAGMAETTVPASPTLSAQAPASAPAGSAISASSISAALAGGSAPTGTVTFKVFGPQSAPPAACTSGGGTVGSASVSGDGAYHPTAGFTPASPGDYWWYASYGGDSTNNPAASPCGAAMAETVARARQRSGHGAKPPALSAVKLGPNRFVAKKGTKLKLKVSQAARIKVVIAHSVEGHRVRGVCKRRAKAGKRCTTTITSRILTFSARRGANAFKLKLRGLDTGSYTATVTAQNAHGKSRAVKRMFAILPSSRVCADPDHDGDCDAPGQT